MKQVSGYEAARTEGRCLNANEAAWNLPPQILREIQDCIPAIAFNRYPDDAETDLLAAASRFYGIPAEQLLAGNGSDQMLGLMIGYWLGKGRRLLTLSPDFSMYDYYASMYEAEIVKFATDPQDGSFEADRFIAFGRESRPDLILFSSPNNPTGFQVSAADIRRIAAAFPEIPVVIDEAYVEFSSCGSALPLLKEYPNLLVTRTLSKAFCLAGVRVGFLAGSPENMQKLRAAKVPYALSSVSMRIAEIVLSHGSEFLAEAQRLAARRDEMLKRLQGLQCLSVCPSSANFLRCRSSEKQQIMDAFRKAGIAIRNYQDDTFRITIGLEEDNEAVWNVLQQYERERRI